MRKTSIASVVGAGAVLAAATLTGTPAWATNGYMGICVGAKNCGMGGAGVALPQDATSGVINPALIGRVENQVMISPGWFHPERSLDRSKSTNTTAVGPKVDEDSQHLNFIEGSGGINYHLNSSVTLGLSMAGSGGMDTKYRSSRTTAGSNGGYDSEVRYRLLHIKPTVAWTPNDSSSYGASLNIGYADFKSNMATNTQTMSETTGKLALDRAWGLGFTLGGVWDLNEQFTLGASLSSPTWFQPFDKYHDLFLGPLDVPANGTVGMVYRATPDTDVAFDVKYIAWSTVYPIGNAPGQGGFGWQSEPVFMLGVQHRLNEKYTLRAGYNYGPSPVHEDVIFANGLFPAVTEHHITVGASYVPAPKWEVSGSFFYALENTMTDDGTGDNYSNLGKDVAVSMWQMGAQIGIAYKF